MHENMYFSRPTHRMKETYFALANVSQSTIQYMDPMGYLDVPGSW